MIEPASGPCPFKVGDLVYHRPSDKGCGLAANDPDLPKPGEHARIARIEKRTYIVWEGFSHPGGSLFWIEFSAT